MSRAFTTRNLIIGVGILAVVTILALVLAVLAQGKAAEAAKRAADAQARAAVISTEQAELAKVQADQTDAEAKLQRDAFCGLLSPIITSPNASAQVRRQAARSAQLLMCPQP